VVLNRTFVLAGKLAGRTVRLRDYQFVDGKLKMTGDHSELDMIGHFLATNWRAFPEGSMELRDAQELYRAEKEKLDGKRDVPTTLAARDDDPVPGDVQPARGEPAPTPAEDRGGDDDGSTGEARTPVVPEGDDARLTAALNRLDPANDEHWTSAGAIRVDAVAELMGDPSVTRADIDRVAPDATRERALAARAETDPE
jgi:hypothetical protein